MSEPKNRFIGWTVSENIGMAIINPRATNVMRITHFNYESETGGIHIRPYSIEITGTVEGAAKAFAEEILSRKITKPVYETWNYSEVVDVVCHNGEYKIFLTDKGQGLIDPELWLTFKKDVEKICRMKAFL